MAFLYKAFVRKNSPELRAKLVDLGYTNGAWESPRFHYPYLSVWPNPKWGLFKGEGFFMTEDDYRLNGKVWTYNPKEDVIDCGNNDKLFLAIAALRDDTDKYQWFFSTGWTDFEGNPLPDKWVLCDQDTLEHFAFVNNSPNSYKTGWKKANIQELINHFNSE